MQITKKAINPTKIHLTIVADQDQLDRSKQHVLKDLSRNVRLQGFRPGKAPLPVVEKQVDQNVLQTQFLEHAINDLYVAAADQEKLRPVAPPQVSIKKFVPFTTLEVEAEVEAVGDIKLPDYKKIKLEKPAVSVVAKDIDDVIANLRTRVADKKEVKRVSRDGDQVLIDFTGRDAKTDEPVNGADGQDYPLILGSNTFIPGFEPNLLGLKAGEDKEFTITFPKDYGVAALQNRKVIFKVTVKMVEEVVEPKVDDAFAAKVSPFKTLKELKDDIKRQLKSEREAEAERAFENELLTKIAEKTEVAIPDVLIDEELDRLEQDERQNLMYRGQTWQEHLAEDGMTEEQHREKNREPAAQRVKAGLALAAVSESEKITVEPQEVEIRLQLMKGQYQDPAMQAELDKPEARRSIASRMLSEKTMSKLKEYVK